jgi:hypothetical protein
MVLLSDDLPEKQINLLVIAIQLHSPKGIAEGYPKCKPAYCKLKRAASGRQQTDSHDQTANRATSNNQSRSFSQLLFVLDSLLVEHRHVVAVQIVRVEVQKFLL